MTASQSLPDSSSHKKKLTARQIVELAGAEFVGIELFTRTALVYFRIPNSGELLCVAEPDLSVPIIQQKLRDHREPVRP
jgi:hypothetical protein